MYAALSDQDEEAVAGPACGVAGGSPQGAGYAKRVVSDADAAADGRRRVRQKRGSFDGGEGFTAADVALAADWVQGRVKEEPAALRTERERYYAGRCCALCTCCGAVLLVPTCVAQCSCGTLVARG